MARGTRALAATHFAAALLASVPLLWTSDTLPIALLALASGAIIALLWITGALMQGRLGVRAALRCDAALVVLGFAAVALV